MATLADIEYRLKRIETRLVRGFSEVGVQVDSNKDWLLVKGGNIYLNTLGRSWVAMIETAVANGAKVGQYYDVVHDGNVVGRVLINL